MHPIESRRYPEPLTPPSWSPSPSSPLRFPTKVSAWTDDPLIEPSVNLPEQAPFDERPGQQDLTPASSPEAKRVQWSPAVQDNQGKSTRNRAKENFSGPKTKRKTSSSRQSRPIWYPSVPDPPRSRGPPSAPMPRRLPTPDLDDLDHGEFCSCCPMNSMSKMDAQLTAAFSHIQSKRPRSSSRQPENNDSRKV